MADKSGFRKGRSESDANRRHLRWAMKLLGALDEGDEVLREAWEAETDRRAELARARRRQARAKKPWVVVSDPVYGVFRVQAGSPFDAVQAVEDEYGIDWRELRGASVTAADKPLADGSEA